MSSHHERIPVPFHPEQMWDLVMDVETYPRFIPWVEALRVVKRAEEGSVRRLSADMVVRYSMFRESFRSEVNADREAGKVDVRYVRGPLKDLENHWVFEPTEKGCIVNFELKFAFKNRLMQTAATKFVDFGFKRLSGAFIDEAHRRYTPIG
ncbi:MAG: type II toxin-antitoxin system RatA family toxin [Pseudomonadota bacterium]